VVLAEIKFHQTDNCSCTSSKTLYIASDIPDEFNMRRSVTSENKLCGIIASCLRLSYSNKISS